MPRTSLLTPVRTPRGAAGHPFLRCRRRQLNCTARSLPPPADGGQHRHRPAPRARLPAVPRVAGPVAAEEEDDAGSSHLPISSGGGGPAVDTLCAPSRPARPWALIARSLGVLYRFSRPHTMAGTTISVLSVSALALAPGEFGPAAAAAAGLALGTAMLMNICIVGVNQIYDVAIDKVNKPHLPIPAGDLTPRTAVALVAAAGCASLGAGAALGTAPLLATLAGSLALGLAYSADLPLLRWKRHPAVAATCILAVRAVLVQAGFYGHMRAALAAGGVAGGGVSAGGGTAGAPTISLTLASLPAPLIFATAMMLAFSVAIALLKDVPDVAGDAAAGVRTLSVRAGGAAVFRATVSGLLAAYAAAALYGALTCTSLAGKAVAVAGHAAAAAALRHAAAATNPADPASVSRAYMFLWRLFYAEYLIIPFMR